MPARREILKRDLQLKVGGIAIWCRFRSRRIGHVA
jgi:hypothetical protein